MSLCDKGFELARGSSLELPRGCQQGWLKDFPLYPMIVVQIAALSHSTLRGKRQAEHSIIVELSSRVITCLCGRFPSFSVVDLQRCSRLDICRLYDCADRISEFMAHDIDQSRGGHSR